VPETTRSFVDELRRLDRELASERLSPDAEARLRALVETGVSPARRARASGLRVALAGGLALLLLVAGALWWLGRRAPAPRALEGFEVVAGKAEPDRRRVRCVGRCTLRAPGLGARLELGEAATVRRHTDDRIELLAGRATVAVRKRPRGAAPLRVQVSHGVIEVLGTRFTIWQEERGGRVELHRGSIRFRAPDGRTRLLAPGQSLSWPLAPEQPAPPAPATPEPPPSADTTRPGATLRPAPPRLTPEAAESLLDEVERLRSQGRYREAAGRLRESLHRVAERPTRERLSYELGTILTHHLRDSAAACRHWRRHLRRFGTARYGREIDEARRTLGCEDTTR